MVLRNPELERGERLPRFGSRGALSRSGLDILSGPGCQYFFEKRARSHGVRTSERGFGSSREEFFVRNGTASDFFAGGDIPAGESCPRMNAEGRSNLRERTVSKAVQPRGITNLVQVATPHRRESRRRCAPHRYSWPPSRTRPRFLRGRPSFSLDPLLFPRGIPPPSHPCDVPGF